MTRPRTQYSMNIRELNRAKTALDRFLRHIMIVDLNYADHIAYIRSRGMPDDERTLTIKAGLEYFAEQAGLLQSLIDIMKEEMSRID